MPLPIKSSAKGSATAEKKLLAAGQLFARQGYHGTSTREIARLAGLSENTLFRHFDHKEDLFWSAFHSHSAGIKLRRDLLEGIAKCEAPDVVLPKILEMLTDTVSYKPELMRLIAVAFLELHWKAEISCEQHLSPVLSAINHYLAMNIKNGKIRDLDSTMLTSALVTTVFAHPGISKLIDGEKKPASENREACRAYARFWLDLLTPKSSSYPWSAAQASAEH